ncbi:hydroxyethylthiazole kinase [Rhodococcoides corynebacterioides]|uniref:Hydroxyethylthiazole kinase n=1 Tax=Rhodococcoides corynebacterioides TaxID=53972 RepID=A0ABS7P2I7_9NOCA|nr:hydroxyethylthiazole kinase [Rhodococcus corynebacterioides]MBY6366631.1 hydroxyethylthiazole kinase [Rhodococcus corynebacterioides]MBY6408694.1 hydroxyethylthiazole kinase [Rhodococcus corynebacterioides]
MSSAPITPDAVADALVALRERAPLVHAVTNYVTAGFTANVLLAAGASAAMVDNRDEAALFAGVADAVLINLGTPHDTADVYHAAARGAQEAGTPWVLDPIGAGGLPWRGALAAELLQYRPAAVRGNASEIIGLHGLTGDDGPGGRGGQGRGVDSSDDPADAVPAAVGLLEWAGAVSASGAVDHVVSPAGTTRITGGSVLLTRVTGTGCSLGALVAAYCAAAPDVGLAVAAAHTHVTVAADVAAERASSPGSFAVAYLDALHEVSPDEVRRRARLEHDA